MREIKGQKQKKLRFGIPTRRTVFIVQSRIYPHPEFLFGLGVGVESEAIYNLCLSLRTVLSQSCLNLRVGI